MTTKRSTGRVSVPLLLAAAGTVLALTFATPAYAGECPADKVGVNVTQPSDADYEGLTDTVIASIDLGQHIGVHGRLFRLRRLEIAPGGVVAWHNHESRPGIVYVLSGSITEYRSTCAVPIEHKAGDVAPEEKATSHWWRNNTKEPVVLLATDVPLDPNDKGM
jgi:quercetin dioxygenase-like cupin family protein